MPAPITAFIRLKMALTKLSMVGSSNRASSIKFDTDENGSILLFFSVIFFVPGKIAE